MSFFNLGPSPTKSSDASNAGDGDFNVFGGGATGAGSFFGRRIVEPVDSSTGSIFSGGPVAAEAGGSMFGSTGSGATRQQEDTSPGIANYGLHGISPPPPAKVIKQDPYQAQASSSTVSATWGAPPHTTARPAPTPSTAWGPPPTSSTDGPTPSTAWGSPQPGAGSHQGRPVYEAPIMSNQKPPAHNDNIYQFQAQATPLVTSQAVSDSSAQSLALSEKTDDDLKKDEEVEEMSADVLKEMIEMQKQQLYELMPQMKRSEERSDQILTSASLVLRNVTNYGEKLAVTKQLYCSRLSQVSSCLRMIPKTEM